MSIDRSTGRECPITILITGGRAPAALELVRLWAGAGHRVVTADSVPHSLCGASRHTARNYVLPEINRGPAAYIDALVEIVRSEQVQWLIPTCEEVFAISRYRDRLLPYCEVLVDDIANLGQLHNKWQFIRMADELGFLTPGTRLLQSLSEVEAYLQEGSQDMKYVLKPVYSRFASRVRVIHGGKNVDISAQDLLISPRYPWVGQQFISGTPYCTYSIVHDGKLAAHAVYAAKFTAGQGASIGFKLMNHPGLLDWVTRFVTAIRFTGQIAFDFIETEQGELYPLECNPRSTSGIHLFRLKDRLDEAFLNSGNRPIVLPSDNRPTVIKGAMLLYGWKQGASSCFRDWLSALVNSRDAVFRIADPMPFAAQGAVLLYFWRKSRANGISIAEAMTMDMEWNGEA
ncbi:ATP-grasp domain-containing protein [Paenibacillus sp. J2TS4]|uniref:ATP-grasp domain-containing protein n=1 Tax=Paenibacillus sp. J2TS4 TaxID=2807194 RepID=UPI001B0AEDB6|nr:ATP-grasp domain-containing protein [Paenibacillus sp. J2TS4]GIP35766.1 hypothetical protein J2TS4_49760 [Paenibacillus sp. J2TS4]